MLLSSYHDEFGHEINVVVSRCTQGGRGFLIRAEALVELQQQKKKEPVGDEN